MNKRPIPKLPRIIGWGFALNLLWENAQAPLYSGYESFAQHFPLCLRASIGDVVILLVLYAALAVVFRDADWPDQENGKQYAMASIMGMGVAIGIELWALSKGRWAYDALMPTLSPFGAGVLPILQLAIIPPLVFWIAAKHNRNIAEGTQ